MAAEDLKGGPGTEPKTTAVKIDVLLMAEAHCPLCANSIKVHNKLREEQLSTGNTTEAASYWAKSMRNEIDSEKKRRGWTEEMCGKCRDRA